jgi:uncharacterized delta-60 repeat protein
MAGALVSLLLSVTSASRAAEATAASVGLGDHPELGALTRAPTGEIVAGGTTGGCGTSAGAFCPPEELLAVRLAADGTVDPGFGEEGIATATVPGATRVDVTAAAVQPDGDVLLAGSVDVGAGSTPKAELLLARFTATGALDAGFGDAGVVTFAPPGALVARASAIAVEPDGEILAAGDSASQGRNGSALIARFAPDGGLDTSFAQGGWTNTFASAWGSGAGAVAAGAEGRIVVAGEVSGQGEASLALARFLPDGRPDPDFGEGGVIRKATVRGVFAGAAAHSLTILPEGDILLAGTTGVGDHPCPRPTLVRLGADGAADAGFGPWGNGVARPRWIGDRRTCVAAPTETTLPSGASLVAGQEEAASSLPLLLSRFDGRSHPAPPIGTEGGEELAAPGGAHFSGPPTLVGVGKGGVLVGSTVRAARCFASGLAAGAPCEALAFLRLRADGRPDPAFGIAGTALVGARRLLITTSSPSSAPGRSARTDGGV